MFFISSSAAETEQIGEQLAKNLRGGDIIALYGELGAGKTTFIKGLARGLGISKDITSPTFTLMNVYQIICQTSDSSKKNHKVRKPKSDAQNLVHIDTYRLRNEQELCDIGVEDYLNDETSICVIEWPEKLNELLKNKKIISITLKRLDDGARKICVINSGI